MSNLQANTFLQGNRYKIVKPLGQGGFGITYLAIQSGLERKVAIKEFFMNELCDRDETTSQVTLGTDGSREMVYKFREKFLKEARRIASLNHPNIVHIIDVFEENGTAYYVMEFAEGGSLSAKLKQCGCLSQNEASRYIIQVAQALEFVHKHDMMHLDVKPANIMLNEKDDAVLIDFGLAKQYDAATGNQTSTTPVGISEGYAPMEQYKQGGVSTFSPATDIYSLGATFFKLLTGITPPNAFDAHDEGLPVGALEAKGVDKAIINLISKAMEGRRKDRIQTASEFISLLKAALPYAEGDSADEETFVQIDSEPQDDAEKTVIIESKTSQPKEIASKPQKTVAAPATPQPSKGKGKMIWIAAIAIVVIAIGIFVGTRINRTNRYENNPIMVIANEEGTFSIDLCDDNSYILPNGETVYLCDKVTYVYNNSSKPVCVYDDVRGFEMSQKLEKTKFKFSELDKYLLAINARILQPGEGCERDRLPYNVDSFDMLESWERDLLLERVYGGRDTSGNIGFFNKETAFLMGLTTDVVYVTDNRYVDTVIYKPFVKDGLSVDLVIGQKTVINASKRKLALFDIPYTLSGDVPDEIIEKLKCKVFAHGDTVQYNGNLKMFEPVSDNAVIMEGKQFRIDTYLDYADTQSAQENMLGIAILKAGLK